MARKNSATQAALKYIRTSLSTCEWSAGDRLPPITELARNAGVSFVTMQRAVHTLAQEGVLVVKTYPGIVVAGGAQETIPIKPSTRWQKVRQLLEQSILDWTFAPGSRLPATGQLASHHKVHIATVKKALDDMELSGLIQYKDRHYVVPQLSSTATPTTILVVGPGNEHGLICTMERHLELIRTIEEQSLAQSFQFETIGIRYAEEPAVYINSSGQPIDFSRRIAEDDIAGILFIYYMSGPAPEQTLRVACRSGKPVAVLDEKGDPAIVSIGKTASRLAVFSVANSKSAGFAVGKHLLRLGHRRVAFCSINHLTDWSKRRMQGVRDAFTSAGISDAVLECTLNYESAWSFIPETSASPRHGLLHRIGRVNAEISAMQAELPPYQKDLLTDLQIQTGLMEIDLNLPQYVFPLFDKVIADEHCTAIVCANDHLAFLALWRLNERGLKVPGNMAVIGFDDTTKAVLMKLSSYNFGYTACVRRMLNYLLKGESTTGAIRTKYFEHQGFIINRATTRQMKT